MKHNIIFIIFFLIINNIYCQQDNNRDILYGYDTIKFLDLYKYVKKENLKKQSYNNNGKPTKFYDTYIKSKVLYLTKESYSKKTIRPNKSIEFLYFDVDENFTIRSDINKLKNLKYIVIANSCIIDINFDTNIRLDSIILINFGLTESSCKKIPEFVYNQPTLKSIIGCFMDKNSIDIRITKLKNLQSLEFNSPNLDTIPSFIYKLTELKELCMYNQDQGGFKIDKDIESLNKLEKLILNIKLDNESISYISKLNLLRELIIKDINDESIENLKELSFINKIEFSRVYDNVKKQKIKKVLPNVIIY